MSDIIQLLPNNVADQIAAGEVIQRPASVVKELMENAVDAGATDIKVVIRKAGKTLIQVSDNGSGMSETDARLAFERHATSKIRNADDLFAIKSKGFRGEALASIAAIAHVDLKSKRREDKLGTHLTLEGSKVKAQEACNCAVGTTLMIKNLFFNVPARRNFLKSDAVEIKHVIEEFDRISLAHPDVKFTLFNENNKVNELPASNLKQRIVNAFGKKYDQRLVPVSEETDLIRIRGFVLKPDFAKKTRGEQYFFVNDRFIKNFFLDHAVRDAFEDLIPSDRFPSYFLFFQIDPSRIDINIHPTKTEIKFQDEKALHAMIHASVKKALGQYNIAPTLNFDQESSFNPPDIDENTVIRPPQPAINPDYNPFEEEKKDGAGKSSAGFSEHFQPSTKTTPKNWEDLYEITRQMGDHGDGEPSAPTEEKQQKILGSEEQTNGEKSQPPYQLHNRYIIGHIRSGMFVLDQSKAHERVLYEQFLNSLKEQKGLSQQQLFPQQVEVSPSDLELLKEMKEEIASLGLEISEFGNETVVINGVPADTSKEVNVKNLIEDLLEQIKNHVSDPSNRSKEQVALAMARSMAIKSGTPLTNLEMNDLVDRLFACEAPYYAPGNRPTIITFTLEELAKRFDQ